MSLQHAKLPINTKLIQGGLEQADLVTAQDSIEVPRGLHDAMSTNHALASTLIPVVTAAVKRSLERPETRMRVLTGGELKRRAQICLQAIEVMYCEQQLSLHQCYHVIEKVLADALLMGQSLEDRADGQRAGFYRSSDGATPVLMETEGEDLAPAPDELPAPRAEEQGDIG